MKFNCGLSKKERKERGNEAYAKELLRITDWHDVFAWKPINIGLGNCRWLETVERRYVYDDPNSVGFATRGGYAENLYNLRCGMFAMAKVEYRVKQRSGDE